MIKKEFILGELKLIKIIGSNKHKKRIGLYLCFCGKEFETLLSSVKNKLTQSCGCYSKFNSENNHLKHGEAKSRLNNIRVKLKQRCLNSKCKDYKNYGGRGITVYEEWKNSYETFRDWALKTGYRETLELDRIDVNGNYEPSNCRWVNESIQRINQRSRKNREGLTGISFRLSGR